MMEPLGRTLMFFGLVLLIAGALVYFAPSIPFLGRLPGDLRIERLGFRFYFPITTCIVISLVLSALFALLSRLR
jgi:hypothetical protein